MAGASRIQWMVAGLASAMVVAAGCSDQTHHHGPKDAVHASERASRADIVDTAIAAGSFKTLVAAVQQAGLVETLKSDGPFTVFAPTDEAFAKLPPGAVEALLKDPPKLRAVLLYHVVPGRVTAAEAASLTSAKTAQGASVSIKAHGGRIHVDGASVTAADIHCRNGVIHVIDTVILPPGR